MNVHSVTTTPGELYECAKSSSSSAPSFPSVNVEENDDLINIVQSMPSMMTANVANLLHLPGENDTASSLVQHYIDDFVHGNGVSLKNNKENEKEGLVVGFVGIGNMGKGMVVNLLKNGNIGGNGNIKHMKLYNRTRDKVDALLHEWKGSVGHSNNIVVDIVDSPIEASIGCDITMVCLGNEEICSDVLLGGGGGGGGLISNNSTFFSQRLLCFCFSLFCSNAFDCCYSNI